MDELGRQASQITLASLFSRSFRIFAERRALTSESESLSYGTLGVRKGDKVAVPSETRIEYGQTYAALASLGAIALTLNIRFHPEEVAYCVRADSPKAIIVSEALAGSLGAVGKVESLAYRITFDGPIDGYLDYRTLLDEENLTPPPVEIDASDIHNVLYTSGTTGRPKGAVVSQGAAAIRAIRLAQWFSLTPKDGFIGWLPLFHRGGDESLYATLLTGGTYATLRKADPEMMFSLIERDRLTWTLLLPGMIADFLHHTRRSEFDLSSMRFAIGYANMMPNVVTELTTSCNIDFYDAFGQTEASYLIAHGISSPGETSSMRKIPSPLMEIRIAGDILVRNPDGTLTFIDRKKYLIKTGGENVYPAEVEHVIAEIPGVQEVCAFGVRDGHWGEVVAAAVVLQPGATLGKEEIASWCKEHLGGYKRPSDITFMRAEELPRSTTGKLQRHLLAAIANPADESS